MLTRGWPAPKTILATAAALYALAQAFFLVNIQFPSKHSFDEFHYVPSAKQFLELKENQNWEHPPLGKLIMAAGIGVFGDRPIGWRFFSTVFGALTLVAMYLWGLAVFRDQVNGLQVAGLALLCQLLYVQARIGMLDTFLFCFLALALAAFADLWRPAVEPAVARRRLAAVGVLMGLSTATKWFGLVPWALFTGMCLGVKALQCLGADPARPAPKKQKKKLAVATPDPWAPPADSDWYSRDLLSGIRARDLALWLVVVPLIVYFATFLPFLFVHREPRYTLWDILLMQPNMWGGQLRVVTAHPYDSKWYGWFVMARPIWYAFDKEGDKQQWVRGVLLLGNPAIMWGGLAALAYCIWDWWKRHSRSALLVFLFYFASYLCWAVIPRKINFYYYYYPAGMTLCLAIVHAFNAIDRVEGGRHGWVKWAFFSSSAALFYHFFPILAALKIPTESFRNWMWFKSWI